MSMNPILKVSLGVLIASACTPAENAADGGVGGGGGSSGADAAVGGAGGAPVGGMPIGGTPVGGTPVGGAPVGGEPVGGAPVGGEPVGGAMAGGSGGAVGGSGGGGGAGGAAAGGAVAPGEWVVSAHPCVGNRTDTLWRDDDNTFWAGCGSTAAGTGLFRSSDGGQTWDAPRSRPNGFLEDFRVSSVSRSSDGLLYVAGINTNGAQRVISVNTSAEPFVIGEVLNSAAMTWNSMHVGTFRRSATGYAVAESLTGVDLAFRTGDDQPFQDGYGWWTGDDSFQMLDLDEHDGAFYGCGSTIAQPPQVFLPARNPVMGFEMDPVQLASGIGEYTGEMWGLDADEAGIVVGGVNQDRDVGMIYTFAHASGADSYDPASWTEFDLSFLPGMEEEPTWIRGACRGTSGVYAVGEFSRRGEGFVLESGDEGVTFAVVSPEGNVPSLHRCIVLPDGRLAVAGADGYFAIR